MKKLKLITLSLLVVCKFQASAQFGYYQDALKYSQTNWLIGSTARMQGLAGTQVALGGDLSLASSNPAGLGFFNKNSASFTLGLEFENSDDKFAGVTTPNFKNTFAISNAGVIINFGKGSFTEEKFKGGSLGLSITKINDFNREYRYEGESGTSITDFFTEQANLSGELNPDNLDELTYAAYYLFIIDLADFSDFPDFVESQDGNNFYITPQNADGSLEGYSSPFGAITSPASIPYQQELIDERGSQYQFNISWGGNYDDRLYFGGGLGLQSLYYKRERNFEENEFLFGDGSNDPWINSIILEDKIVARGAGINTSFGLIIRPVNMITIGISYRSPTFFTINEESDFTLTTNWNNFNYIDAHNSGDTVSLNSLASYRPASITKTKYNLKTPSRLNMGGTIFISKSGFISGEVEMVDYANAELKSDDFSPLLDNQKIIDSYKSVLNYRFGAEYRIDNIRLRGGYALYPDPTNLGFDRKHFTFGLGYKTADYFIDLAVVNTKFRTAYTPYNLIDEELIVNSVIESTRVSITAGFNF